MVELGFFVAQINLGLKMKKLVVTVTINRLILKILWCLYKNGYITSYSVKEKKGMIYLKYYEGKSVLTEITQISKISRRIFQQAKTIDKLNNTVNKRVLLSTTDGLRITQKRYKKKLGGEVLVKIA